MRKKNLMTAVITIAALTIAASAPMTIRAEETETVTEAAEEATEASEEITDRPDYTASDYVELGEYKGLQITKASAEVTDDDILEAVTHYASQADVLETLTEGTVQRWDTADIDYEGKLDGEAFDGGTAKGYELEIGSNTFISGFEDGLIGVAVGETVDLPLTFPENYSSTDLAGQDVVFTVTVNSVKRAPELTDELVGTLSDGAYSDVNSYLEYIRSELQPEKETEADTQMKADLLSLVAAGSTIKDYPQDVIDYLVNNERTYYEGVAEAYSMEFGDFLSQYFGLTEEEFEENTRAQAELFMQQELYLKAVAEAEGIEVSQEEFDQGCQEYASQYGYESVDDFISQNGETNIRASILQSKVLDFLLENAVITEETESESETGADEEAEEAGAEVSGGDASAGDAETENETEGGADAADASDGDEAETEQPDQAESKTSSEP